ncbi:MAG: hypothetical protein D3913_12525, partial [Candidatus Electrothrix sp. LOE1_4_5]|nr:hypothetical protein [Candidatus Electrothrix gigas]
MNNKKHLLTIVIFLFFFPGNSFACKNGDIGFGALGFEYEQDQAAENTVPPALSITKSSSSFSYNNPDGVELEMIVTGGTAQDGFFVWKSKNCSGYFESLQDGCGKVIWYADDNESNKSCQIIGEYGAGGYLVQESVTLVLNEDNSGDTDTPILSTSVNRIDLSESQDHTSLIVSNTGGGSLAAITTAISGDYFSLTNDQCAAASLEKGNNCECTVHCETSNFSGTHNGNLTVSSSNAGTVTVPLTCAGGKVIIDDDELPILTLPTNTLSLNDITAEGSLFVTNSGKATLEEVVPSIISGDTD